MKKLNLFLLLAIVALAVLLRIYRIGENYFFEGELGKELLYLRQYYLSARLPITGMATSHEWLSYGPFYYWIMMPVFAIFKGNPFILFWSALTVSVAGIVTSFYVIKKIIDAKVAMFSALIMAISPLFVWQTQNSKLHVFFFILIPMFTYFLYLVWNGKKKWIFWAGLVFGLMFSFHFSQIPLLIVVALIFWIKKSIYKWGDWIKFAAGIIIPNITLIWQDKNLALWLPYRALNLAYKNPLGTWDAFVEYFGRNIFWDSRLWIFGFIIFILIFAHYIWTNRRKITKEFVPFYLISSIGIMLLANIIHGAFPVHYFLPIFTTVPVLFAIYLSKYRWRLVILILFAAVNFKGYFNFEKPKAFVAYQKQTEISDYILKDDNGKPFSIKRIGDFDYFPEQYSQNYKYLLLWKGGNLVENSANVYTIIDRDGNPYVQKQF